ncbi:hypothetical protein LB823_06430 [Tsukamurella sp. M9C]|uniref:hypothetical protein n=1 Tax=Tsukamurella sp. M9C TaxID=2877520 RepID=UPI001CCE0E3F|nr:hypothetical protein [Tsukamurella sp. M9C]MCA0155829.1 hypothetical protein [Tsukamurella sp. M9C]
MVTAIHFYATAVDHARLLDHLGEPDAVTLHPWPVVASPTVTLSREAAMKSGQVLIADRSLGPPVVIREGSDAMSGRTRSALFNRLNWDRLAPGATEGIVDSNASPVLYWEPATCTAEGLTIGSIGSQADSMRAVSADFERWVNRTLAWVRRNGTQVWGLTAAHRRTDLDVLLPTVSSVYALPEALLLLEAGTPGR